MDMPRPDPESILKRMKAAESRERKAGRGRLKIFFGYAAGVGKTYAMLKAAKAALAAGVDLLVGYVEPHSRPETLTLLEGLPLLPPREMPYRNIVLKEFDLDAALKRRPQLVLVDELAHTNAEGSRNLKRWQDVEELLTAGISVNTTLNAQHLESLGDLVSSITGVSVRERVPDSIFDMADQVELVDIEPADLIERLRQGKIYRPDQAGRALDNFFVPENLVRLRETALRRTADAVNKRVERDEDKPSYHIAEHVLVCLSSSPSNGKVIRTAERLATAFHGDFTALFVETLESAGQRSPDDQKRLADNTRLAERLGAKIVTVNGQDVPAQIAEYAKVSAVSKLVIGRSGSAKGLFAPKSLVARLTELAPDLDVYIIPDQPRPFSSQRTRPTRKRLFFSDISKALALLILTNTVCLLMDWLGFGNGNLLPIYILGVLITALLTRGFLPGALFSLAGVLSLNYLFVEPRFSFNAGNADYWITFAVMLLTSFLVGGMTSRTKDQALEAARRAWRLEVLLENSQKLQRAVGEEAIMAEAVGQLTRLLRCPAFFYPARNDGLGRPLSPPWPAGFKGDYQALTSEAEEAVAQWVFKNNKAAGAGTDTLPGAKCLYLPVGGHKSMEAVAALALGARGRLDPMEKGLVTALLSEAAMALEKERLSRVVE